MPINFGKKDGGDGGIRTHERISPLHAFQACSFNRSDTSPQKEFRKYLTQLCRVKQLHITSIVFSSFSKKLRKQS